MRIVCPSCTATYEVPDRLTASGKRLRCAQCAHEWIPPEMAAPEPAPLPLPPPALPPPTPPPAMATPEQASTPLQAGRKPRLSARRSARVPVALALAASVFVLACLAAAALHWRGDVMRVWPPSRLLFAALGVV